MLEQVKIITSRRAYEFGADDIRLSTLSIGPIQQQIQKLFGFQSSTIGTPIATFGPVPATFPPGVVFNIGAWIHQEERIIPIRFIHFEQSRIVIDIAGPTVAIDSIAERLFHFLSGLESADGSPVVAKPVRMFDYSEITAHFPHHLDGIFAKPFQKLLGKTMKIGADNKFQMVLPTVAIQAIPTNEVLLAVPSASDPYAFTLALRSGTRPDEYIYFSGAPLDSEEHLRYLNELEAVLTKNH